MRLKLPIIILLLSALALFLLAFPGCNQQKTVVKAGGEPAYAPAIVDNLLQSLNNDDYAAYTRDFDAAMKSAMPETVFEQTRAAIEDRIGDYVSREFTSTEKQDNYTVVFYKAKFSKEPVDVTMKFVFSESGEKAVVAGLWFTSPKLSGQ